jgi:hypothetical protein
MSNLVQQIEESLTNQVSIAIPTYQELDYIYDTSKNNLGNSSDRYGVAVGGLVSTTGAIKHSTVDQIYVIKLIQMFVKNGDDDTPIRNAINEVHDKMDDVLAQIYNKKAGLPQIVINIIMESIDDPIILEDDAVELNMNINVKYRRSLS